MACPRHRRILHAAFARRVLNRRVQPARATGARTPPSQAARTLRLLQAACDKRRAHSACRKWRAHSACCKRLAPRRHLTTATSLCHPGGAVPDPSGRCRRTNRRGRARGRRRSAVFQTPQVRLRMGVRMTHGDDGPTRRCHRPQRLPSLDGAAVGIGRCRAAPDRPASRCHIAESDRSECRIMCAKRELFYLFILMTWKMYGCTGEAITYNHMRSSGRNH